MVCPIIVWQSTFSDQRIEPAPCATILGSKQRQVNAAAGAGIRTEKVTHLGPKRQVSVSSRSRNEINSTTIEQQHIGCPRYRSAADDSNHRQKLELGGCRPQKHQP